MSQSINILLWSQFGAALDMLENALRMCPEEVWSRKVPGSQIPDHEFWYLAFHTLFWTDCYLNESSKTFAPPAPFTTGEFDPAGVYPDRVYTKAELFEYLEHCREKTRSRIVNSTEEGLHQKWDSPSRSDYTILELLLYNMRHVQHHAAQLNLILRQTIDDAPRWVSRAKS